MTPFHIKLYYLLTEKNTGIGQSSSHFPYNRQHHHGGGGHNHSGSGYSGGSKGKQKSMMMGHQGGLGPPGGAMYVQSIEQVSMPKKLLVLTNQQEVKESRQIEAKKLNVSWIGKKKKRAIEQNQVGQDETQQACLSLLDYCAERASQKVKDKRVVTAPNEKIE